MNTFAKGLLVFGLSSAVAVTAALGGGPFQVSVDELGNMTFNGSPAPPGTIGQDPISGLFTLCYQLPFAPVAGDVLLMEPGTNVVSDIIRFPGNGNMYFFSELELTDQPPFDPADVPVLPTPMANNVLFTEVGLEGETNGLFYVPAAGQPGFQNGFFPQYTFISDVPEPSTVTLLGLGVVGLLAIRRRKKM